MKRLNLFYIARQNLKRKLFRSLALIISVAIAAGTLFSGTLLMKSVENSLEVGTARLGADLLVVPKEYETVARATLIGGEPSAFYMDRSIEQQVASIEGVKKTSSQVFIASVEYECCSSSDTLLIAFDPSTDFTITPWLETKLDRPLSKDEVILGRGIPWLPGQRIFFFGHDFTVAATLEKTGMRFFDDAVFMPIETAYEMAEESRIKEEVIDLDLEPNQISTVLVQVQPDVTPVRVGIWIEHDISGVKAIASEEVITSVRRQLFTLLKGIFALSGIIWIMALLMIGAVFSMIVNERQREIGLLRAMGATKGFVFKQIVLEATLLTMVGGILGVICGGVIILAFKNLIVASLKIPYLWPAPSYIGYVAVFCFILAVLMGIVAALYPATISSKMEPYSAIRKGE
jgi:putative ABC transport system permease protein